MEMLIKIITILIMGIFSLIGCSKAPSYHNIEPDCFNPFSQDAYSLFDLDEPSVVFIWPIGKEDAHSEFFSKHGYLGYLTHAHHTAFKTIIAKGTMVTFTGTLIKKSPTFAERNLGGGKDRTIIEIEIEGLKYLVAGYYLEKEFFVNLPERCKFANESHV